MQTDDDGSLILAAEEFNDDEFERFHAFSSYEERVLRALLTHGPVLLRGGRGCGKSALMLEANRRMTGDSTLPFSVYVSLRYLPLLKCSGAEYINLVTALIADKIREKLKNLSDPRADVYYNEPFGNLHDWMLSIARALNRRIVLLLDDAAHIGRESSLADFFDLFRTMSSEAVSCKAAIYPGVTKFGSRFDVYNDSTVVDIARNESSTEYGRFFLDVIDRRFNGLSAKFFTAEKEPERIAAFLGRVVLGNMRAFVFACKMLSSRAQDSDNRVGLREISECMKYLASEYYWPLLDELAPKLGAYAPQICVAQQIAEALFVGAGRDALATATIHREHVQRLHKGFEILEYTGFLAKRDASKVITRGGRGPRYTLNLANLLEHVAGVRVTKEHFDSWLRGDSTFEVPVQNQRLMSITAPVVNAPQDMDVLGLPISSLLRSKVYPYGLTPHIAQLLSDAGVKTVEDVAKRTDGEIDDIPGIGVQYVKRIRAVVDQAIWM